MDAHEKSYVCTHVFNGERPVLYVTRPDRDWCFLCGGAHSEAASSYRVVGMGHVVDADASLRSVLDLAPGQEAERSAVGAAWSRSAL